METYLHTDVNECDMSAISDYTVALLQTNHDGDGKLEGALDSDIHEKVVQEVQDSSKFITTYDSVTSKISRYTSKLSSNANDC